MTFSTRSRFILISVSITVLALTLFTSVIYDRAIQYKHQQDISVAHVFADQFVQSISKIKSMNEVSTALAENIAIESQSAVLFVILDKSRIPIHLIEKKHTKVTDFNDLLSEIQNNKLNEGRLLKKIKPIIGLLKIYLPIEMTIKHY